MALEQSLGQYELIAIGIGSVIGCGIFFLFRNIMLRSGPLTALAFLIAAVPNIIAALCYAEVAGMYVSNAVEYECLKDAFNEKVASVSIYVLLMFLIFNSTTILIFSSHVLNLDHLKFVFCIAMLLAFSIINFFGIDVSKKITNTMSIIELGILTIVILFGMVHWRADEKFVMKEGLVNDKSFWMATFLALFLYTGYDTIVKLTEETIEPKKTVPRALVVTITIVTVMYILLAYTAICLPNSKAISNSVMPIATIFEGMFGKGSHTKIIYLIGLFIVLNTFFVCILSLSRFVYGLSKSGHLPNNLSEVNERFKTPHNAIIVVFFAIAISLMVESGEWAASLSNIFFLIFLIMLAMAVIILRIKQKERERPFKIPFNIRDIPILPVFGIWIAAGYIIFIACHTSHLS